MGADKAVASGDERPPAAGSPSGYGWQDRDVVAVLDAGLEALLEADVLAGDVDVDEAAQRAVLGDPLPQAAVRGEDGGERPPPVVAPHLDLGLAAGGDAELGRDLHGDAHLDDYLLGELGSEAVEGGVDLMHGERIAGRVEGFQG